MSDLFASHKVMRNYLNALLTEDVEVKHPVKPAEADVRKQQLKELLAQASPVQQPVAVKPVEAKPVAVKPVVNVPPVVVAPAAQPSAPVVDGRIHSDLTLKAKSAVEVPPPVVAKVDKEYRNGRFQALFFEVAGLKVALPLKELGGIHKIATLNTLPGKPSWYKGVMLFREQKINVVDTALWVMPEKYDNNLAESLNYQYVIMLGKSSWGLACEKLINTVSLEQDDVKWRAQDSKRPWLAGLIKEHMCALLDVDSMTSLLAQGASSAD